MAELKWIKITTDIFDDEKILLIESMPDADAIIVIWLKLLCLAGKQNNGGVFLMNDRIPYTDKMLATIFRRKESTVQMALNVFEQFGMIEIVENVITIPKWEKHQNIDALEKAREQSRIRMQRSREKKRQLLEGCADVTGNSNVTVTQRYALDKNREEKEQDIDKREETPYQAVVALYHEICVSFPRIKSLSDARRKAIKARLNTYTLEQFREMFGKAEASDFLKGRNNRNWSATFDWMMNGNNFAKIIDGNYDNKCGTAPAGTKAAQDLDNWYNTVREWADN